uniref:Uncharacterized protein n=1 Tax=Guillardia theta (strain CCMP2712) TaxID=905079 RepID=A0A0C3T0G2_GUITC
MAKQNIDVNVQDKHGTSALHLAATRRQEKIVKLLLAASAEVNIQDKDNKTPLEIVERAFGNNQRNVVNLLLLHGANPNVRDIQGSTPILYAASAGSVADTIILLKFGSDVNAKNFRGLTALHMAAAETLSVPPAQVQQPRPQSCRG